MEDILGLTILSFFIWICYLNWKKFSVMVDCSSYYSEPSVSQEYKMFDDDSEMEYDFSETESYCSDYSDPEMEYDFSETESYCSDDSDSEMEYEFSESDFFWSNYPDEWLFPKVLHLHIPHIPGMSKLPVDFPPEYAIVFHIHSDKEQIREFFLRFRKDFRRKSKDYIDYLIQLFLLNPMFSHDPSTLAVSKITEDPVIPCELPLVTKPVLTGKKKKNKLVKALTIWKKWIATHSRKMRTERGVPKITKPAGESKRKNKFRMLRSNWEKWIAYFSPPNPSQNVNDSEDHTVRMHENVLDEFTVATKQKADSEQSEAEKVQKTVDHHILYVGKESDYILEDYKRYRKVYHIHYLEISEDFLTDINEADLNQDTFTFQDSPATDTAQCSSNLPYESPSATKPDIGGIFENEGIIIPLSERGGLQNNLNDLKPMNEEDKLTAAQKDTSVTTNKKNEFGKLRSKLKKWTAVHFPRRKAKGPLEVTEDHVDQLANGLQGARENQEQQKVVEDSENKNIKQIKKKKIMNFGRKIKSWFFPKTRKEQRQL
ncbi:Uncharacterized protein APZ42_018684 [Daphnia magna]|uniref:Uncharacterized protein n=1 Tax=Daphnia magna TaxID=35525 RepID=A0A162CPM8_9CRUS|nr:Uncharacterized protein APZ42_018684 [Daphnia magna]